jgi:sec-independent protein translocase protein TatA
MPNLRGWEIFILLAIVLLLFGSKKLPDAARGVGRSLRIFKAETKGLMDDDQPQSVTTAEAPAVESTDTAATTKPANGEAGKSAPASGSTHT